MRSLSDVRYYLGQLFFDNWPPIKWAAMSIGIASGYLFDQEAERAAGWGVWTLVIVDLITGVLAAIKNGKAVRSILIGRTLNKAFGYLAVIAVAAVCEHTISREQHIPAVTAILSLMIAKEGYSVLENVHKMGVGKFGMLQRILEGVIKEDDEEPKKKRK